MGVETKPSEEHITIGNVVLLLSYSFGKRFRAAINKIDGVQSPREDRLEDKEGGE